MERERYSFNELADMHLMYGAARGNGREAERLYAAKFPSRRHPHHSTFSAIDRQLRESGSFRANTIDRGRQRVTRASTEALLNANDSGISARGIARDLGISATTVYRRLQEARAEEESEESSCSDS